MEKRLLAGFVGLCLLIRLLPTVALAAESSAVQVPELESLTVTDSKGIVVSLLDGEQSIHLGTTYSFAVKFSNSDHIGNVYITSTKQGKTDILEAVWDGEAGAYVTNGVFADDPTYLPGRIGVRYTEEAPQISVDDPVDWAAMNDALAGKSVVTMTEDETNSVQASVDISSLLGDINQTVLDLSVDVFDAETGADLDEFLGQYKELDQMIQYMVDGGGCEVYLDYRDPSAYVLILKNVSQNKWVKMILEEGGDAYRTLAETAIFLEDLGTMSSFAGEYLSIQESAEELREEINQSAWIEEEDRKELLDQVDAYENDRYMFQLSMTVLPVVAVATIGSGPIGMAFNALLGVLGTSVGFFWEHRVGMISGGTADETSFTNDAHGIPIQYWYDGDITESGTYYVHEDFYTTITISEGIDVTLCMHGNNCSVENNGGTLVLLDCQNVQNEWTSSSLQSKVTIYGGRTVIEDGHFTADVHGGTLVVNGGQVEINRAREGCTVELYGGIFDSVNNDGGDVTFYDGFANSISNADGSMDIRGGTVEPTYKYLSSTAVTNNGEEGELTIRPGAEIYAAQGERAVSNSDGKLVIMGGTITGFLQSSSVLNSSGEVIVYDGTITGGISGSGGGTIEINGGKFYTESGECVSNSGRGTTLTISDGEFYATSGGTCVDTGGNNAPTISSTAGHTLINGGTFVSLGGNCLTNTGFLTISGGTFTSQESEGNTAACLESSHYGEVEIDGGEFLQSGGPCIANADDSTLTIADGTFTCLNGAPCVYSDDNLNLIVSGGTFFAPDGLSAIEGQGCTVLLGENSDIEISARSGLFRAGSHTDSFKLSVETAPGYDGGIMYFDFPESEGVRVTAAQVAAMDFSQDSYLRLECDKSLQGMSEDGVSISLSSTGNGLWTATVSSTAIVLTPGLRIWAASYMDGKMTSVTVGILQADGTVTFSGSLDTNTILFFLDDAGRPMCGTILLQN